MRSIHLLTIALLSPLAGCEKDGSDPLVLSEGGNYSYEAYGPSGGKVLEGMIHLEWPDPFADGRDAPLVGSWEIDWVAGADTTLQVGPQVGHGTLEGIAGDEGVILNLNPEMADNNVFLHAIVDGNAIMGNWTWSTITGPRTEGLFTASSGR